LNLFRLSRLEALTLGLVFLLALAPRLAYVLQIDSEPFSDMADYDNLARSLLRGEGFARDGQPTAYRPPLYPVFLAIVYRVAGPSPVRARVVQAFLGAANCMLVFFLARHFLSLSRLRGNGTKSLPPASLGGLLAAVIVAFYDEWIFYTGQLLSETLYVSLLVVWLLALIAWMNREASSRRCSFAAHLGIGLLAAVLTLTRPVALFSILPAIGYALCRARKKGGRIYPAVKVAALFLAGWCALALPWMIRNAVHFGPLAGLSTNTGVNFYIGHNPYFGYWSTGDKEGIRQRTDLDEARESRLFLRLGLSHILQQPGTTALNTFRKVHFLFFEPWRPWPQAAPPGVMQSPLDPWNPWSEQHIAPYKPWPWFGHGRELPPAEGFRYPLLAWDLPLIGLVALGLALALWDRCPWALLYWAMGGHIVSCLVFFSRARFRIPLGVIFSLLAAYALTKAIKAVLAYCHQRASANA